MKNLEDIAFRVTIVLFILLVLYKGLIE